MANVVVRFARHAGLVALFVAAATAGTLSGVIFAYAGDLPQISALDDYTPSTITRVYAADNQLIGEFATQRRVVVGHDDINPAAAAISRRKHGLDTFGINFGPSARPSSPTSSRCGGRQGAST